MGTHLANMLEQLEARRTEHVLRRRLLREEGEDGGKNVALVEIAVDKVRVDLEAGAVEADGGWWANDAEKRRQSTDIKQIRPKHSPCRRRLSRALSKEPIRRFRVPERTKYWLRWP